MRADHRDATLVRRMAAGDENALVELYDRWHLLVHTIVIRIVRVVDDSDDVVEAAFWQSWKEAGRYDPARGEVRAWLCTIARSRALDCVRSAARRREDRLPVSTKHELLTVALDDPAMDLECAERRALVLAALDKLPPEQRETLDLAYFDGLSQTEIALRLQLPLGTVKTRVRLALRKLRGSLHLLRESFPEAARSFLDLQSREGEMSRVNSAASEALTGMR